MRFSQGIPKYVCERVRATEHAPRDSFQFLERRHGLAEIVERGATQAVLSAAAVGGSDDDLNDGSLSSAADDVAAATA